MSFKGDFVPLTGNYKVTVELSSEDLGVESLTLMKGFKVVTGVQLLDDT